jgi:hypothetical protein
MAYRFIKNNTLPDQLLRAGSLYLPLHKIGSNGHQLFIN